MGAYSYSYFVFVMYASCLLYLRASPQPYYQAYTSGAPVELDYVSIAMIVVGYYIGTMAAKALGVDGTCKEATRCPNIVREGELSLYLGSRVLASIS